MTKKEALQFIKDAEWVYAKSYADTFPHEYTTRDRVNDDEKFDDFVRYMRDNAKAKAFFSKAYLYCEIEDLEYWEMGRPIRTIRVINRAIINDNQGYRNPTLSEDDTLSLLQALKNREKRLESLLRTDNRTEKEEKEMLLLLDYDKNKLDKLP